MNQSTRDNIEAIWGRGYAWAEHGLAWEMYKRMSALEKALETLIKQAGGRPSDFQVAVEAARGALDLNRFGSLSDFLRATEP